ncbi:MAG TPA: hypothetical protein VHX60_19145 [Acidobacteriaceae bacterium]|jgi:hypothetical protein|nr:hypothetical protein [Acidobacteriaceae bacterium]
MKNYRSSIPRNARERITATHLSGPQKFKAEYRLGGETVGVRFFHPTGELQFEYPLKNGVWHGTVYRADDPGMLTSAEPFRNGLAHGTARQWSPQGNLLGTYTMRGGCGVDLWWQCAHQGDKFVYLAEARYLKDGQLHGFEWWLTRDQRGVLDERHFWRDQLHGIERAWNSSGRLRRGYPRYWASGQRVTRRKYLRACETDPNLPRFREIDNQPARNFPAEVRRNLRRTR